MQETQEPSSVGGPSPPRLLIVDDELSFHGTLRRFGQKLGFETSCHQSGIDAIAALPGLKPDVALVDLRMPGMTGLELLRAIRAADPECQVILMTGDATVDTAVEAVKGGALDYLSKPLDLARLRSLLEGVRDGLNRRAELLRADTAIATSFEFHGMTGRSAAMQTLFDAIRRFAPHARTALVTGETGTGKELVARALHKLGPRRDRRLVSVNCAAVVDNLFESELFGHVRGSFTGATDNKVGLFEHADGGTLFLDEAGELPPALQAKLLRAIEYGEIQRVGSLERRRVDVHVIAATNRDLRAEMETGFRADLFYRLSTIEIALPPLRDRREDIPYLTALFVRQCAERLKRPIAGVSPAAEGLLQQAPWPGNIRELRNVVERACILSDGRILSERELLDVMPSAKAKTATSPQWSMQKPQRADIEEALRIAAGNKAAAAKALGLSRQSLYRFLARYQRQVADASQVSG